MKSINQADPGMMIPDANTLVTSSPAHISQNARRSNWSRVNVTTEPPFSIRERKGREKDSPNVREGK